MSGGAGRRPSVFGLLSTLLSSLLVFGMLELDAFHGIDWNRPAEARSAVSRSGVLEHLDIAYVLDDFERVDWPDPALWITYPGQAWRSSVCRSVSGSRSLRAFGGKGASEAPCNSPSMDAAAEASVIDLRLDLRTAATANRLDLEFELWLGLPATAEGETPGALFIELFVPSESGYEIVTVFGGTSSSGVWTRPRRRLDLTALTDVLSPAHVYDLRGGVWTLRFRAIPSSAPTLGDIFIDDLTLIWEPDLAVPTPTVRPASTVTPTPTARATRTPLPTQTTEPTPSPEPNWSLFLPWSSRALPPVEPSPEPTSDPSAEPSAEPTAEPSAEPTAEPTSGPTYLRYLPSVERITSDDPYPGP